MDRQGHKLAASSSNGFGSFLNPTMSTHGQVARMLGADILSGAYPPGHKLPPEQDIMERFGISRTVLREVLRTLTAKGLIASRPRVGTSVRDRRHWNFFDADVLSWRVTLGMDDDFRAQIAQARLAVEVRAAELAAERATDTDILALRQAVDDMRVAAGSPATFAQADLSFHQAIGAASGNFLLNAFSTVTEVALVASFLLLPVDEDEKHEDIVQRHERVVVAIEARDAVQAGLMMRALIEFGAATAVP